MDTLLQDLRYACRTLVKNPGFAALTIICLALGVGVNSTIFSVVDTVAIRPLPFKDPGHLTALVTTKASIGVDDGGVSYLDLRDWKDETRSFETMGAASQRSFTLTDRNEPERFVGCLVTADLFPTLGIQPALGRQFRPEEDRADGPPVVLLSDGVWQRRYAADPSIVGRTIMIDGKAYTVIGVMPPRFQFPERAQFWLPAAPVAGTAPRTNRSFNVFGRLKPGTSISAARQDLAAVAKQLAGTHPEDKDWGASVLPIREDLMPADIRLIVMTMMGAVTLVLLIACANVANLLLARATVRQREIAVRAALGAGRGRIVRQLLTESVLIAVFAAPLGVALAYVGLQWLTSAIPPQRQAPYYVDWSMNARVVVYTCAIAVVTGLVFGLAPALQAARKDLHDPLKEGGRGAGGSIRRNRLRSTLVVAEIALSLVLLVGASLFVRSFLNLQQGKAGLETAGLMLARFSMMGDRYGSSDAMVQRVDDIVHRIETLPGVVSVTASDMMPYMGGGAGGPAVAEGLAVPSDQQPNVQYFGVTPQWLRTLNVGLVSGRDFTTIEATTRSYVAVVNQVFAKRLWPNLTDVVGQRFRLTRDPKNEPIAVIGTVGDFRLFTVRDGKPAPYAFLSYASNPVRNSGVIIRVGGVPATSIAAAVRREVRASDQTMAIYDVQSGDEARAMSYWQYGLFGWMFSIFGAVALVLASIGVYGVLSYSVSQRTQEIGVRMALGASRQNVFGLIVAHGAQLAGLGIICGVVGAFGVTRVVNSMLYNVSATDPFSFVMTAAFLALVAIVAAWVPARRATAVDPMIALRAE